MIHFNAELWNNHQLCVLQDLNEKETIPTRKEEKLAKAEMLQHNFIMSRHNLKGISIYYVATKIKLNSKLEMKNVVTFHNFVATQNERD